jgi:hypothetical protein
MAGQLPGECSARRLTTPCCCSLGSASAAQLPPCRHLEYCIFCSRDASRIVRPCSSTSSPSAVANFLPMRLVRESVSVIAQSHVAAWPLGTRKRLFSSCLRAAGEMMACGALQLTAHDGHTIVKFIAQSFDYGSFDVPAKITNSRIVFSSRLPNCKRRN